MLLALFLAACQPEPSLPEVWGPAAAEDLDPARDVVEVHLEAAPTTWSFVEGGPSEVYAYNGQIPGPLIQATVGDTLRVVFTNHLDEPTTIHWHGLRIPDEMDGVPAVQDPVQPGETFTYEFVLPEAGSFWYHPHMRSDEQIEKGLQGPLVVHEAEPPPVRERYFVLDDVAVGPLGKLAPFGGHMDVMMGRYGNVLLVNGEEQVLEDTLVAGAPERWRLVNTANARTMFAEVTGASWRVIAVDGTLLEEPYETIRVRMPVGRRFDLEVVPDGTGTPVQLLVDLPATGGFDSIPVFEGTVEEGRAEIEGFVEDWGAPVLSDPVEATQEVNLDLNADTSTGSLRWTINGAVYGEGDAIPVDAHTPTRITIHELSGQEHPFHLHGQFFRFLTRNDNPGDVPGQLDTVLVPGGSTVELYSELDNPGIWMAHCHILEHAEAGMMTELHVEE